MVAISPTISIITLSISGLNTPVNTEDCYSGSKNKTQLHAVYKKPTLNVDRYYKERDTEKYPRLTLTKR